MTDNELTLRDFDEESEETDSETELLIRHTVHNRSRSSGSSSNAANKNKNNNNGQRLRKSSTGYSGIGGPTTIGVVGGGGSGAGVGVGSNSGSFLGNLFSLGSAAGQIRYRNERSRERAKYSNSNNSGSGRDSGSVSASRDITSDQTKLAQLTQTGAGGVDSSKASHPPHAEIGSGAANGSISAHTVIDQENGASTVFYQNNRRRSKGRSLSNVCRMCFCRCVQHLIMPQRLCKCQCLRVCVSSMCVCVCLLYVLSQNSCFFVIVFNCIYCLWFSDRYERASIRQYCLLTTVYTRIYVYICLHYM